jgi:hypothetical protein
LLSAWQEEGGAVFHIKYAIYDLQNQTWSPAQSLGDENARQAFATDPISPPNFFALLWTENAGNVWAMKYAKIPTNGSGFTKAEKKNGAPVNFAVMQNYPNPAGASTLVRFGLKAAQNVSIRLYSLNGRLIETLASNRYEKGSHEITCRFKQSLPAGVYALRLEANGRAQVRNITVVR